MGLLGGGFGQPTNARKPYAADYNRAYDTHTSGVGNSREFEVNNPVGADEPFPGTPPHRAYKNPLAAVVMPVDPEDTSPDSVWQREIQTGNAPSGGYSIRPYYGFAANLGPNSIGQTTIPDNRRLMDYQPSDWELYQKETHELTDAERQWRRTENVQEDLGTLPKLKFPNDNNVHAVEHSPYEMEWPESDRNRLTSKQNPNPWRFWRDWDKAADYRGSGSRYNNGTHYSMAQHNTLDPYVHSTDGGTPVRFHRNTYRLDPQPWDGDIVDSPQNTAGYQTTLDRGVNLESSNGRAYRI